MKSIEDLLRIERKIKKEIDSKSNKYLLNEYQLNHDSKILDALIVANIGLVNKIANKLYQKYGKYISGVIDIDDLTSCGMTGLVCAIERFDFNKYAEFSVYATYWIRQRIVREVYNNMGQFRIPVYKIQHLLKENVNHNDLLLLNYFSIDQIKDEKDFLYLENIDTSKSFFITENSNNWYSPEYLVIIDNIRFRISLFLNSYKNQRNAKIYSLRNGLLDGECQTLESIAKKYNMTRERIRQICEKIDEKLKASGVVDESDLLTN